MKKYREHNQCKRKVTDFWKYHQVTYIQKCMLVIRCVLYFNITMCPSKSKRWPTCCNFRDSVFVLNWLSLKWDYPKQTHFYSFIHYFICRRFHQCLTSKQPFNMEFLIKWRMLWMFGLKMFPRQSLRSVCENQGPLTDLTAISLWYVIILLRVTKRHNFSSGLGCIYRWSLFLIGKSELLRMT